ncbi:MAG: hypothetical protein ABTQ29_13435 [Siculibacillus sp.]
MNMRNKYMYGVAAFVISLVGANYAAVAAGDINPFCRNVGCSVRGGMNSIHVPGLIALNNEREHRRHGHRGHEHGGRGHGGGQGGGQGGGHGGNN